MSLPNIPDNFAPSDCLDCKGRVLTGTLTLESVDEFVIIHEGGGCPGFMRRFSKPGSTVALTSDGERVPQRKASKPLPGGDKK